MVDGICGIALATHSVYCNRLLQFSLWASHHNLQSFVAQHGHRAIAFAISQALLLVASTVLQLLFATCRYYCDCFFCDFQEVVVVALMTCVFRIDCDCVHKSWHWIAITVGKSWAFLWSHLPIGSLSCLLLWVCNCITLALASLRDVLHLLLCKCVSCFAIAVEIWDGASWSLFLSFQIITITFAIGWQFIAIAFCDLWKRKHHGCFLQTLLSHCDCCGN